MSKAINHFLWLFLAALQRATAFQGKTQSIVNQITQGFPNKNCSIPILFFKNYFLRPFIIILYQKIAFSATKISFPHFKHRGFEFEPFFFLVYLIQPLKLFAIGQVGVLYQLNLKSLIPASEWLWSENDH